MSEADEELMNLDAKFFPMTREDHGTLPCVEVGGVQVYAYVKDGGLVVSVDAETADPRLVTHVNGRKVGMRVWVRVSDRNVYWGRA